MENLLTLLLVRHGEVEEAYRRVFAGRLDVGLSTYGHWQATQTANWLATINLSAIYVSPMQRARQTAEPLIAKTGLSPQFLPELVEMDFGAWTGLTWEQVEQQYQMNPLDWLSFLEKSLVPGAEPTHQFLQRLQKAIKTFSSHPQPAAVAAITHGGVIRGILSLLLGLPLGVTGRFKVDYGSVTIMAYTRNGWLVKQLNLIPWDSQTPRLT